MNFDTILKPLIPTTRSCNSLMRKIKYNLYVNMNDKKRKVNHLFPNMNDDLHKLSDSEENSESLTLKYKENISISDNKLTEKFNNMISAKISVIDANKLNENESSVRVLKTVLVNGELFPTSLKQQSNEDELIVSTKKLKPSEKLYEHKGLHGFEPLSSNCINGLNFDKERVTLHNYSAECSYKPTNGSKRPQPSSFKENDTSKRIFKTKSRLEKNLISGNQNQTIDSDCQKNPKCENVGCATLSYDSSSFEHSENSLDSNEVPRLTNESVVRENKWVTKASPPKLSVSSTLNLKYLHSNFLDRDSDKNTENITSKVTDLINDQNGITSSPSDIQWPLKMSPCDPDSPECKPIINTSEHIEADAASFDNEGNNNPKTEHLLSLRNSEELISKLVSSRHSVNENEHTQIYALPMDQKLSHVEHPYVENAINSSTRDLEVVNVLSPVSINSTDIPMNKSSWVPDMSLVHSQNDHNDVDGDHSQPSTQMLTSLFNSMNANTSRMSVHSSDAEHFNHTSLETSIMARTSSYNRMEPRMYSDESYRVDGSTISPNDSSVSNLEYVYDKNRIPLTLPIKTIPISVSLQDSTHELNEPNTSYCGNTINLSFNGLKKKCTKEPQLSYNFAMIKSRPTDISTFQKVLPCTRNRNDALDVVSDEFSDVDSMDLRINSAESKEVNLCSSMSMSSLISTDLKSINPLNSFDKSLNWSTIKTSSESSSLHQKQKLKIYSDPTELISGPVNLNKQPGLSINLNEAHVQKAFVGNKSPPQVYYSPIADFCVSSSDVDTINHGNLEDTKPKQFKNKLNSRDCVNISCSNDKYDVHSLMPLKDNESVKQTLISGYDGALDQNSPITNNGLMYKLRSDSNSPARYESPHQLQLKNPDCLSPRNGLSLTSFDQLSNLRPISLEDSNLKEEQAVVNMAHLMLQSSKNCKVHYKWPLNKNKSQSTASNEKFSEISQNLDYKKNVLFPNYSDDELNQTRLQNVSPNEILNQSSGLSFNERKNNSSPFQSSQQFQDISNLILPDLSPTIQSDFGSDSTDEKKPTQSRVINYDGNPRKESSDHQETMYRNAKMSNQSQETSTTLSREVFEAARYLFNKGKLLLCMYPKCANSHHFRVIPSNAEMLRHEFTVPFDDFRFNIQYKYKQLLTSNPRTWPSIPILVQLNKRCLCEICGDFDSKLNQNQEMLHTYVEGKKPSIEEDNNENEQPSNPQIRLSWKKNLANRFSTEAIAKQSISQMIDDMEKHISRFTRAFTLVFALSNDVKINSQNLQNACESYLDDDEPFNSECVSKLEMAHKHFNNDLHLYSYQYLQLPKVIPKYVLEELSSSSYQPTNHNALNTPHQFDEEHLPNELNRYYVENSTSPSYQSVNSNLANQSLKYIHENIPNTSLQPAVENSPSTSRQSSVGNLTNSPHQSVLNKFPASHGISLDPCSTLSERVPKHGHMSCYYSDGQMFTEFSPHTYLPVPSAQFPNSSTHSYYSSPVNMPSESSVPFCSPSLSVNSVPNSPSSDCSLPSLVETVATAVPEHALLDDSLEAVNAAHNLMLISNRHRYNSTTSIATTNTTDTITVATTITSNTTIVTNSKISTNGSNISKYSITCTTRNNSSTTNTINDISSPDSTNNIISTTDTVHSVKTEPKDHETDIVHNSRKKKKKKHDKKKDKKKKGKR